MTTRTAVATNPAGPVESRCSGCKAPVRWRYTPSGARQILDHEPIPHYAAGAYVIESDTHCRPAEPLLDQGQTLFMNHWATCPKHDDFRTKRPRRTRR